MSFEETENVECHSGKDGIILVGTRLFREQEFSEDTFARY